MSLKVEEDHALKAVPDRIFSVAMHPMESRLLAFAGDKWGKLGIWDVVSLLAILMSFFGSIQWQ